MLQNEDKVQQNVWYEDKIPFFSLNKKKIFFLLFSQGFVPGTKIIPNASTKEKRLQLQIFTTKVSHSHFFKHIAYNLQPNKNWTSYRNTTKFITPNTKVSHSNLLGHKETINKHSPRSSFPILCLLLLRLLHCEGEEDWRESNRK